MKRLLPIVTLAALLAASSALAAHKSQNPYENPFYGKYLNTGSATDAQIQRTIEALRQTPESAPLHNQLGSLLVQKGFPRDAEREFERAVNADGHYYAAWYNLGLVRAANGDGTGARRAFYRTVDLKPGHAAALFQLGLIEEQRENYDRAVHFYSKAYAINPALLDVDVNPRVLDSKLTHVALLQGYSQAHTRESMQFQGAPIAGRDKVVPEAPSPQASPRNVVTPAPPVTDPSMQSHPPGQAVVIPVPPSSGVAPAARSTQQSPQPADPAALRAARAARQQELRRRAAAQPPLLPKPANTGPADQQPQPPATTTNPPK
jgi:tetratricopeptide (TPR) repeat protein